MSPSRYEIKPIDSHFRDYAVHTIGELRKSSGMAKSIIDEYGDPSEKWDWREMEWELREFTAARPGLMLRVRRWGEERDDVYAYYFLNGLMYQNPAKTVFPTFEESELIPERPLVRL